MRYDPEDYVDESSLHLAEKKLSLMERLVPGHFRAMTFWECLFLGVTAYVSTGRWAPVFGIELVVVGLFIADQATHLDQPNHSNPAPTKIERWFQYDKVSCITVGVILAIGGLILALT